MEDIEFGPFMVAGPLISFDMELADLPPVVTAAALPVTAGVVECPHPKCAFATTQPGFPKIHMGKMKEFHTQLDNPTGARASDTCRFCL